MYSFSGRFSMRCIRLISAFESLKAVQKPTSSFGQNSNCAPLAFRSSKWTTESPVSGLQMRSLLLLCTPAFRENCSGPRPRQMTPSDKNDIFHVVDSQASLLGEPHAVIDIVDYPFFEISASDSVLPFGWERKI